MTNYTIFLYYSPNVEEWIITEYFLDRFEVYLPEELVAEYQGICDLPENYRPENYASWIFALMCSMKKVFGKSPINYNNQKNQLQWAAYNIKYQNGTYIEYPIVPFPNVKAGFMGDILNDLCSKD